MIRWPGGEGQLRVDSSGSVVAPRTTADGALPPPAAGMKTLLERPVFGGRAAVVKRLGYSRFARPGYTDRASPERRRGGARFASRRYRDWLTPERTERLAELPEAGRAGTASAPAGEARKRSGRLADTTEVRRAPARPSERIGAGGRGRRALITSAAFWRACPAR